MFLSVEAINKRYGSVTALSDASFAAAQGEILALLGPSGCGKTTLLNLIAGFLTPDAGHVRVAGRDLTGMPPDRRDMGMVFQNYALFPHLTVERNVAFGLEARRVPKTERAPRTKEALERVGLWQLAHRYPAALSGGQQQRVALARALVVRPSILLLDEPLSNLDTQLRKEMQEELRVILRSAGITAVMVTHDQEEALVIADRVLLMHGGRIEQDGSPEDVYERPRTVFGARFMEATNLIDGVVRRTGPSALEVETGFGLVLGRPAIEADGIRTGQAVTMMIRPERIQVLAPGDPKADNHTEGTVLRTIYLGTCRRLHVRVGASDLTVDVPVNHGAAASDGQVTLGWQRIDTHVLLR